MSNPVGQNPDDPAPASSEASATHTHSSSTECDFQTRKRPATVVGVIFSENGQIENRPFITAEEALVKRVKASAAPFLTSNRFEVLAAMEEDPPTSAAHPVEMEEDPPTPDTHPAEPTAAQPTTTPAAREGTPAPSTSSQPPPPPPSATGGTTARTPAKPLGRKSPPLLTVYDIANPTQFRKILKATCTDAFKISYYDTEARITVSNPQDFTKLKSVLTSNGAQISTFAHGEEKTTSFTIRGLSSRQNPDDLLEDLQEMGMLARRVRQMTVNNQNIGVFVAAITPTTEWPTASILRITSIWGNKVKVSKHNNDNPQLCYRCARFGHSSYHCTAAPKCLRCSEPHTVADCAATEFSCPSCRGKHPGFSKECPRYITEKEKKEAIKTGKLDRKAAKKEVMKINSGKTLKKPAEKKPPAAASRPENSPAASADESDSDADSSRGQPAQKTRVLSLGKQNAWRAADASRPPAPQKPTPRLRLDFPSLPPPPPAPAAETAESIKIPLSKRERLQRINDATASREAAQAAAPAAIPLSIFTFLETMQSITATLQANLQLLATAMAQLPAILHSIHDGR